MTVKNGKNGKHYDYDGFVEKFKPKKTTDDCYTPPEVYDVVLKHVREKYNIADDVPIVRPFYPGGDYEHYDYPEGCVVVDNPPFSIFARILDFYQARGIRFFLFAPQLTALSALMRRQGLTFVSTNATVIYHNGANMKTGFVTSLSPDVAFTTSPSLYQRLEDTQVKNSAQKKIGIPRNVFNVKVANKISYTGGVEFELKWHEVVPTCRCSRTLKGVFGGGFLMCDKAAERAERAEEKSVERTAKRSEERAAKPADLYVELEALDRQLLDELNRRATP